MTDNEYLVVVDFISPETGVPDSFTYLESAGSATEALMRVLKDEGYWDLSRGIKIRVFSIPSKEEDVPF